MVVNGNSISQLIRVSDRYNSQMILLSDLCETFLSWWNCFQNSTVSKTAFSIFLRTILEINSTSKNGNFFLYIYFVNARHVSRSNSSHLELVQFELLFFVLAMYQTKIWKFNDKKSKVGLFRFVQRKFIYLTHFSKFKVRSAYEKLGEWGPRGPMISYQLCPISHMCSKQS